MTLWIAVAAASLGCLALKAAGLLLGGETRSEGRLRTLVELLPVALLSGLIAVSTFAAGSRLVLDSRAAGVASALILVASRAPFLAVVGVACAVAALVHALHP